MAKNVWPWSQGFKHHQQLHGQEYLTMESRFQAPPTTAWPRLFDHGVKVWSTTTNYMAKNIWPWSQGLKHHQQLHGQEYLTMESRFEAPPATAWPRIFDHGVKVSSTTTMAKNIWPWSQGFKHHHQLHGQEYLTMESRFQAPPPTAWPRIFDHGVKVSSTTTNCMAKNIYGVKVWSTTTNCMAKNIWPWSQGLKHHHQLHGQEYLTMESRFEVPPATAKPRIFDHGVKVWSTTTNSMAKNIWPWSQGFKHHQQLHGQEYLTIKSRFEVPPPTAWPRIFDHRVKVSSTTSNCMAKNIWPWRQGLKHHHHHGQEYLTMESRFEAQPATAWPRIFDHEGKVWSTTTTMAKNIWPWSQGLKHHHQLHGQEYLTMGLWFEALPATAWPRIFDHGVKVWSTTTNYMAKNIWPWSYGLKHHQQLHGQEYLTMESRFEAPPPTAWPRIFHHGVEVSSTTRNCMAKNIWPWSQGLKHHQELQSQEYLTMESRFQAPPPTAKPRIFDHGVKVWSTTTNYMAKNIWPWSQGLKHHQQLQSQEYLTMESRFQAPPPTTWPRIFDHRVKVWSTTSNCKAKNIWPWNQGFKHHHQLHGQEYLTVESRFQAPPPTTWPRMFDRGVKVWSTTSNCMAKNIWPWSQGLKHHQQLHGQEYLTMKSRFEALPGTAWPRIFDHGVTVWSTTTNCMAKNIWPWSQCFKHHHQLHGQEYLTMELWFEAPPATAWPRIFDHGVKVWSTTTTMAKNIWPWSQGLKYCHQLHGQEYLTMELWFEAPPATAWPRIFDHGVKVWSTTTNCMSKNIWPWSYGWRHHQQLHGQEYLTMESRFEAPPPTAWQRIFDHGVKVSSTTTNCMAKNIWPWSQGLKHHQQLQSQEYFTMESRFEAPPPTTWPRIFIHGVEVWSTTSNCMAKNIWPWSQGFKHHHQLHGQEYLTMESRFEAPLPTILPRIFDHGVKVSSTTTNCMAKNIWPWSQGLKHHQQLHGQEYLTMESRFEAPPGTAWPRLFDHGVKVWSTTTNCMAKNIWPWSQGSKHHHQLHGQEYLTMESRFEAPPGTAWPRLFDHGVKVWSTTSNYMAKNIWPWSQGFKHHHQLHGQDYLTIESRFEAPPPWPRIFDHGVKVWSTTRNCKAKNIWPWSQGFKHPPGTAKPRIFDHGVKVSSTTTNYMAKIIWPWSQGLKHHHHGQEYLTMESRFQAPPPTTWPRLFDHGVKVWSTTTMAKNIWPWSQGLKHHQELQSQEYLTMESRFQAPPPTTWPRLFDHGVKVWSTTTMAKNIWPWSQGLKHHQELQSQEYLTMESRFQAPTRNSMQSQEYLTMESRFQAPPPTTWPRLFDHGVKVWSTTTMAKNIWPWSQGFKHHHQLHGQDYLTMESRFEAPPPWPRIFDHGVKVSSTTTNYMAKIIWPWSQGLKHHHHGQEYLTMESRFEAPPGTAKPRIFDHGVKVWSTTRNCKAKNIWP